MIKDLHAQMSRAAVEVVPSLKASVHHQAQAIVHGVMQPLIQQSNKKKRKEAASALAALYNLVGDMDISVDARASAAAIPGKKPRKLKSVVLPEGAITLPTRVCAPTSSQLFAMRSVLGALVNLQSDTGKGGLMKEKDLTSAQLQVREQRHLSSNPPGLPRPCQSFCM